MRFKKIMSGLLACALVAGSVFAGSAATVEAEATEVESPSEDPVYLDPFTEIPDNFNPTVGDNMSMKPGETMSVKKNEVPAQVKDAVKLTYESLTPDVAAVDANGNVTAKNKIGYALIITRLSALSDGYTQEYYTLVKVNLDLSGVKAAAKDVSLAKGKKTTLDLTIPGDIKNPAVTYRTTGGIAFDADTKTISAQSAGTGKVIVKVSAGGKSIIRKVTVNVGEITGASKVKVGQSTTLSVNGLSGKAKWTLNAKGKKLAKLTSGGKLTAKKAGKVTVTAKVGNVTMTKTITIKKK